MNCGGGEVTSGDGALFAADRPYEAGVQGGFVGGEANIAVSGYSGRLIGGYQKPLQFVHYVAREDWQAYRFELANGDYIVRLLFSENRVRGEDLRRFDVTIEGESFLDDLDVAAEFGVQYAGEFAGLVTVADGVLDIEGLSSAGTDPPIEQATILNGIEIWAAPVSFTGTEPIAGMSARASYHRNLLTWNWRTDPAVAGYNVYRSESAGGPFTLVDTLPPGPPRWFDEDAVPGEERFYRVAGFDFAGMEGPQSDAVSASALDSADSGLRVYDITVSPENLKFIAENVQLMPSAEVPASFEFEGTNWPDAEVRFRGNSSRWFSKKSWKIKFSPNDAFEGRTGLNLKASFFDPSMLRERFVSELYAELGLIAFESRPVHLRVNGRYAGTFNEAEQIDARFLAARDRDTGADLFKCEGNLSVLPTVADYELTYEKKTNESTGHADLIELIEFLGPPAGPDFVLELSQRFDIDAYLSYMAVVGWAGDWDTTYHNYFMCHDRSLERWELLPWDSDAGLGFLGVSTEVSVLWGTTAATVNGPLINRLRERVLGEPALLWRYVQKLIEFEARFVQASLALPRLAALEAEVEVDITADPYKYGWESPARFEQEVDYLELYLPLRSGQVIAEAATLGPAAPPTDIWINEVVAADQDQFADDAGEFEDWIELYNASDAAIDVGGMFMTDDLDEPDKWEIPGSHPIAPGGHLLVWCDDEPEQGELHATFKLSGGGEAIGLFNSAANGGLQMDGFAYGPQVTDLSQGPIFDGEQPVYRLLDPSPGAPNRAAAGAAVRFDALTPNAAALSVLQPALLGGTLELAVQSTASSTPGVVFFGGQPTELPIAPFGIVQITPAANPLQYFVTDDFGAATVEVGVPVDPAFEGFSFLLQAYVLSNEFSNALHGTIGS